MSAIREKMQEKFALLQQMKREKELKEAKAKENQPFDIFALAGVKIPITSSTSAGRGQGVSSRNDGQQSVERKLRVDKSVAVTQRPIVADIISRRSSQSSSLKSPGRTTEEASIVPSTEKKLKRSSMATRNTSQVYEQNDNQTGPNHNNNAGTGRSRQLSIDSTASTFNYSFAESPTTATPPTPIASPLNENSSKQDLSDSLQPQQTHSVQSCTSVDENEEMVLNVYGRSIPRSRCQSLDAGSELGCDSAQQRKRRPEYEEEYQYSHRRLDRYESRYRSRSRSCSPKRRNNRRSRSRSVSPHYSYIQEGDLHYNRGHEYDHRNRRPYYHNGQPDRPYTPGLETDPFVAASHSLDIAFYPTKVYVGNLPESASLTSLRVAFRPFGDIDDMNIVEDKDYGFVTFKEPEAAQQALEKMNGAVLEGTVIRVNRAKIPERNHHGFAGVAWMDEDGELTRMEEEQHKQAAAIAKPFAPSLLPSPSVSSSSSSSSPDRPTRTIHQLPPRPRSPKPPLKPANVLPPIGTDPRAVIVARGGGRQILKYDDL
ncbi:hypothetical protein BX616_007545 [Lobosporangium transversale]|nr:hypothetical protein BX616_007545 [Lobosporangium transversale]